MSGGEKSELAAEVAPGGAERAEHGEAPVKEPSRRLGGTLGRGLTSAISASRVGSISRSRFGTRCVPN